MSKPRNLALVIDSICEIAPDLKAHLADCRSSAVFAAPEMRAFWWSMVAKILNEQASDHPQAEHIRQIFADETN